MKKFLFLLLLPVSAIGQLIDINPKDQGHPYGFIVVKPSTYTVAKSYPLIISLHGVGGRGNGSAADLSKLMNGELPKEMQRAAEKYDMVIIAPQTHDSWTNAETDYCLAWAAQELKINWKKVYHTGISLGGGGVTRFSSANLENAKKFAACIISCGLNWISNAKNIADAGTPFLFFHAQDDNTVSVNNTNNATAAINYFNPPIPAKKVIYATGQHWIWGKVFSPDNKPWTGNESPATVYDWLLMNETGSPVAVPEQVPSTGLVIDAGSDITTSTAAIKLDGSKSSGYKSAKWTPASVPAGVNIWSVNGCGWIWCNVTLPAPGTYVFKLILTDEKGATVEKPVTVFYNSSSPPPDPEPVRTLHSIIYFPDGTWLKVYTDKTTEKNY